ncbi:MAG: patatin-like phospholipase family protein [Bacteroidaceae bacterium]
MGKKILLLFISSFCVMTLLNAAQIVDTSLSHRKRVAVVLSGGGARGVAHIGALKVIEEAGFPIDYIVGTSMGAIVAGVYAIGYSPKQMDSVVRNQDWMYLLTDRARRQEAPYSAKMEGDTYLMSFQLGKNMGKNPTSAGLIKGQNIDNFFFNLTFGYHDSINFKNLPIPFACVATDIIHGKEFVFHSGVLAEAMRTSMTIPAMFAPVHKDDMMLIDGGILNNYPVDVARAMGADIVIGIDVQDDARTSDQIVGMSDVLSQLIDMLNEKKHQQNIANTDIYIKVPVKGFTQASFSPSAIDSLIERGEQTARAHWNELIALRKSALLDSVDRSSRKSFKILAENDSFPVHEIHFSSIGNEIDASRLLKLSRLKGDDQMTMAMLQNAVERMYATEQFESVNYKLTTVVNGEYNLLFTLKPKKEKRLRVGIRFDNEEIASAILSGSMKLNTFLPSQLSLTGRLGRRSYIRTDYNCSLAYGLMFDAGYMFQYNDINIYENGDRVYNTTYAYHKGELGFSGNWKSQVKWGLGLHFESYNYKGMLYNSEQIEDKVPSEDYLSYYGLLYYDTFNKRYFPSKGTVLKLDYSLYTDNMVTYHNQSPFSAFQFQWRTVFSLTNRFALLPSLYGRFIIGHNVAYPYYNMIGGDIAGHYMAQQLPFAGINNVELSERKLGIVSLQLRYRIYNHYFSLIGSYGIEHDKMERFFYRGKSLTGVNLNYAYESLIGPIQFTLNYSSRTKQIGYYINVGYVF